MNKAMAAANGLNPNFVPCLLRDTSFGEALMWAKERGARIARTGWNGKGMWVCVGHGAVVHTDKFWNKHTAAFAAIQPGGMAEVLPYMIMKTADNKIQMGWLASQSDMLTNDWCVLED